MKSLLIITTLYYLSIKPTFSDCGSLAERRLGIRTTAINNAGSDEKIFANIYSNGSWDEWRKLDNAACDDFVPGSVDYFDDFESITDRWEGIALYSCGDDGLMIETVWYWNGVSPQQCEDSDEYFYGTRRCQVWRPGVFGPMNTECLYNNGWGANPANLGPYYSDILVKGGESRCDGVVFGTTLTTPGMGDVWTGELPGYPNCTAFEFGQVPIGYDDPLNYRIDFEQELQQLSNYSMLSIGITVLAFVLNAFLIIVMVRKSHKPTAYGKVKQYDSEA